MENSDIDLSYPFTEYCDTHKRNVFFGVFAMLLLLVFRPFGLSAYSYGRSYIIIGYGLIIWLTLSSNDFWAYRVYYPLFRERGWTVVHQFLWTLFQLYITGITCCIYAVVVNVFPENLISFLKMEVYVLLSSIIPIIMMLLIKQNYLLSRHRRLAKLLNKELNEEHHVNSAQTHPDAITIEGDNRNEQIELIPDQIDCIIAVDNYFEIVWQENEEEHRKLLRGTLTMVEDTVRNLPFLFRCHKDYLVNLNKVTHITGKGQGYRLQLKNHPEVVPVSRFKGQKMHRLLKSLR